MALRGCLKTVQPNALERQFGSKGTKGRQKGWGGWGQHWVTGRRRVVPISLSGEGCAASPPDAPVGDQGKVPLLPPLKAGMPCFTAPCRQPGVLLGSGQVRAGRGLQPRDVKAPPRTMSLNFPDALSCVQGMCPNKSLRMYPNTCTYAGRGRSSPPQYTTGRTKQLQFQESTGLLPQRQLSARAGSN